MFEKIKDNRGHKALGKSSKCYNQQLFFTLRQDGFKLERTPVCLSIRIINMCEGLVTSVQMLGPYRPVSPSPLLHILLHISPHIVLEA